jgi:hypothetical protein
MSTKKITATLELTTEDVAQALRKEFDLPENVKFCYKHRYETDDDGYMPNPIFDGVTATYQLSHEKKQIELKPNKPLPELEKGKTIKGARA